MASQIVNRTSLGAIIAESTITALMSKQGIKKRDLRKRSDHYCLLDVGISSGVSAATRSAESRVFFNYYFTQ